MYPLSVGSERRPGLCIIAAGAHAVCHEAMVDDADLESGGPPMTGTMVDDIDDEIDGETL